MGGRQGLSKCGGFHTAVVLERSKKGTIQDDNYADLMTFDRDNFKDRATHVRAFRFLEGLLGGIIHGRLSDESSEPTETLKG